MSTNLQNFYKATITKNWTATTGDFNVSVKPNTSSGWLVISPNNTTLREIVKFTATGTNAYGDFVTISSVGDRGIGGTTAQTHNIGESIRMNITAEHWAEMQADIAAIIAGTSPTGFSYGCNVYRNTTNQAIPNNAYTKVQLNGELWDFGNEFDSTTNYRYTATTAGYYSVCFAVYFSGAIIGSFLRCAINKNGSGVGVSSNRLGATGDCSVSGSQIVQLGIGDYIELEAYQNGGVSVDVVSNSGLTYMAIQKIK